MIKKSIIRFVPFQVCFVIGVRNLDCYGLRPGLSVGMLNLVKRPGFLGPY